MSKTLIAVTKLLAANQNVSISSTDTEPRTIYVEDEITDKSWRNIKEQFEEFPGKLEGIEMWTWDGYDKPDDLDHTLWYYFKDFFKKNLYAGNKKKWDNLEPGRKIRTYFRIQDSEKFLKSLLRFIDEEKVARTTLYAESKSKAVVERMIKDKQDEYGQGSVPLAFDKDEYVQAKIPYYKVLTEDPLVEILRVELFVWGFVIDLVRSENVESISDEIKFDIGTSIIYDSVRRCEFERGTIMCSCVHGMYEIPKGEALDIVDLAERALGKGANSFRNREKSEKSIRNAVANANKKLFDTFGIEEFFQVEGKAYRRRF